MIKNVHLFQYDLLYIFKYFLEIIVNRKQASSAKQGREKYLVG